MGVTTSTANAGSTLVPINTYTVTGSASGPITFSSIPSTYTNLVVIGNFLKSASDNIYVRFNSDTGTNYSDTILDGYGAGSTNYIQSFRDSNATAIHAGWYNIGAQTWSTFTLNISNYANTNVYKTTLSRASDGYGTNGFTAEITATAGLWRSTAAINSITLGGYGFPSNWAAVGTMFTIYGIKAA